MIQSFDGYIIKKNRPVKNKSANNKDIENPTLIQVYMFLRDTTNTKPTRLERRYSKPYFHSSLKNTNDPITSHAGLALLGEFAVGLGSPSYLFMLPSVRQKIRKSLPLLNSGVA
jgi:hypothetical protein